MTAGDADKVVSTRAHLSEARIGWFLTTIVLVQCAGLLIPSHLGWGFNYWRLFPIEAAVVVLGIALIIMSPWLPGGPANRIGQSLQPVIRKSGNWNSAIGVTIISLILFACLYLLRSRAHVYGDGFLAIEVASTPMKYWPFNECFMKPLSLLLFRFWNFLLSPATGTSSANVLSAVDAVAGVIGFWAIYRISRLLVDGSGRQWFLLLGSIAGGGVILFFGYIEYYTWAVSIGLWSLAFTIGYLKHRNRLWPAFLSSIIATGFHFFAMPTLVLAIIAWRISPDEHGLAGRDFSFMKANLALVLLSMVAAAVHQFGNLPGPVLAVWPNASGSYWAFSLSHLADIANETILVAPLGLVGLVYTMFNYRKPAAVDPAENMLFSASLFLFLLTFWINPVLGAARDWDLLSFFGIPFSMWGVYALLKHVPVSVKMPRLLMQVTVLSLVLLVPNLYEKSHPGIAAERLDDILWEDPHYQSDYRQAYNSYQWGGMLIRDVGNTERSIRYLKRAVKADPTTSGRYATLATAYNRLGLADSAYFCYRRALDQDPGNERILMILSSFELKANRPDRLLTLAHRAVEVNPGSGENHYLLSFAYGGLGSLDSALAQARTAIKLKADSKRIVIHLGRVHGMLNHPDSSYYYISKALEIAGPEHFTSRDFRALFSSAMMVGRFDQARLAAEAIARLQPKAERENNSRFEALTRAIDSAGQEK